MQSKVEDLEMGLDLIKTYGFQPKQFDYLYEIFKKEGRMPPISEI